MDRRLAAWTRPRSDVTSAYEDVERCRGLSPAARVAEAAALSRSSLAFLDRFPASVRERLLFDQEPLAPEHEAALRALVRRARAR